MQKFRLKLLFQELDLSPGSFFIGRSPSCNLTIEDPLVSRHHARIILMENEAHIEDLDSRNGTSLNGARLRSRQKLANGDRIRIGAHDLVFVEEREQGPKDQRPTGVMVLCDDCGAAFSAGVARCPHCGAAVDADRACHGCGLSVSSEDFHCVACGADLRKEESQQGKACPNTGTWKANLVVDVLEKAMDLERFDQAMRIFEEKKDQLHALLVAQGRDTSLLKRLSFLGVELAAKKRKPELLSWVIERWVSISEPMPDELFDSLRKGAQGWYNLRPDLERYLGGLDADGSDETQRVQVGELQPKLRDGTES